MTVPSNLIPKRFTQLDALPDDATTEDTLVGVVFEGNNYLANVGEFFGSNYVPITREINTGTGLTGGGDLSVNRTISIANGGVGTLQLANSGATAGTYGSATSIPVLAVDSTGRITSASSTPLSVNVPQGGTGVASLTANNVILGNGTSAVQFVAPSTSGNVLTSNGTTWISTALPAPDLFGDTDSATPFETSLGYQAGNVNTGVHNTFLGYQAGTLNTTGTNNVAVGNALVANTTGIGNTAIGSGTLSSNTTASGSTAIGASALSNSLVTGTAVGYQALLQNTTGTGNTAVGYAALNNNTTGITNTAVGFNALFVNTIGSSNVALGASSLDSNTTGNNNTAVGRLTLSGNTTGANNTAVGYQAGNSITTGTNLTVIGYDADASSATATNEITLGNSSVATLRCQVTTITALSDARDKKNPKTLSAGLDFINALHPVEFEWAMRDGGKVGIHDTGLIAQEIKEAIHATGVSIPGLVYDNNPERLEVGYGKLIPPLIKALQELSEKYDILKTKVDGVIPLEGK